MRLMKSPEVSSTLRRRATGYPKDSVRCPLGDRTPNSRVSRRHYLDSQVVLTDLSDPYDLLAVDEAWQLSWAISCGVPS